MFHVISIGSFAGGSFGVAGDPNKTYEYWAVAGDRDAQGFPNFASRHREAVENYRNAKIFRRDHPFQTSWEEGSFAAAQAEKIYAARVEAIQEGNTTDARKLAALAKILEEAAEKPWEPLPHAAANF